MSGNHTHVGNQQIATFVIYSPNEHAGDYIIFIDDQAEVGIPLSGIGYGRLTRYSDANDPADKDSTSSGRRIRVSPCLDSWVFSPS